MPPAITIVTPSFNQHQFIEETICSVLDQGYPNLEYFVIDGGSGDGSVEVIARYARWLTYWVSEPDRGQAHAINKGWQRATGEILAYLNSDDTYLPGALNAVAAAFAEPANTQWVSGACISVDERNGDRSVLRPELPDDPVEWLFKPSGARYCFPQPGVFLRKALVDALGPLREDLRYSFDYEYFERALFAGQRPLIIARSLALFRVHDASKTASNAAGFAADDLAIADLYFDRVSAADRRRLSRQKQFSAAWVVVNHCAGLAITQGPRAARHALWQHVFRDPRLLQYRPVWGALRRW